MARTRQVSDDLPERVGVLEAKVEHVNEKIDDLKVDVKEMHDCLDRTRDTLTEQLNSMLVEYRANRDNFYTHSNKLADQHKTEHTELAGKISDLEKQKHKITLYIMVSLAFAAGAGWINKLDAAKLLSFLGL